MICYYISALLFALIFIAIIIKGPKVTYHVRINQSAAQSAGDGTDPWGKNCKNRKAGNDNCWEKFVNAVIEQTGGTEADRESFLKENNRTLRHISFKMQARGGRYDTVKMLIYYTDITHSTQCGHISTEYFEGSSSVLTTEIHRLPKMTLKHKHWCFTLGAHVKVSDALWDLYVPMIPRAGGPQKPHKLFEQRMATWESTKNQITLYRIASSESCLPAGTSGVTALTTSELDGTEMKMYIGATDESRICLMDAIMLNYIGIGGKNNSRAYFKALSAPQVSSQQVYYCFPGNITNAVILAGIHEPYMQHLNTLHKKSADDKAHKIAQMFKSWGYLVLKDVKVKSNGTANIDKHYIRFMYPGGYHDTSVHDDVMQNVRDDLELVAKMMTEQKKANQAAASGSRIQLKEIDEKLFKFFGKDGPKVGNMF